MHFDFDMGKYVVYVWSAYGVTCLALGGLVVASVRAHASRKSRLEALQQALKDAK